MNRISIGDIDQFVHLQGSGHPLVLVHGFPLDHQMWKGQFDFLSQHFQIIAPDLRGFGRTSTDDNIVLMEQFADDLAALLEGLAITQPVAFCGLSMGGYIGWQFWKRHRSRLAQLILCDTRAAGDPPDVAATRLETADRVLNLGSGVLVDGMIPKLFCERTRADNQEVVTETEHIMQKAPPKGVAAALRGMAQRVDATSWLPEIETPTLIICGRHDAISTVSEMEQIAASIPQARFTPIEDAGHMAPLENPTSANKAILDFLSGNSH